VGSLEVATALADELLAAHAAYLPDWPASALQTRLA
jgi:hypothetical protein